MVGAINTTTVFSPLIKPFVVDTVLTGMFVFWLMFVYLELLHVHSFPSVSSSPESSLSDAKRNLRCTHGIAGNVGIVSLVYVYKLPSTTCAYQSSSAASRAQNLAAMIVPPPAWPPHLVNHGT